MMQVRSKLRPQGNLQVMILLALPNDLKHYQKDPLIGKYLNVVVAVSSPCNGCL